MRHMFSHHILKPERTPIEANVWGTPKSSGSFSNLFRGRLLRAIDYRLAPTEVGPGTSGKSRVCAPPFTGEIEETWPAGGRLRGAGDLPVVRRLGRRPGCRTGASAWSSPTRRSSTTCITRSSPTSSTPGSSRRRIPPPPPGSTRRPAEVQDPDAGRFAAKLRGVFRECRRILEDDGLLVFTYHHSRDEGWKALAEAVLGAGFAVVNSQPVKAEMSVATPKSQAKEPIQLDIIVVCRKAERSRAAPADRRGGARIGPGKAGPAPRRGVRAIAQRPQDRGPRPAPDDARRHPTIWIRSPITRKGHSKRPDRRSPRSRCRDNSVSLIRPHIGDLSSR